jgi:hypothetical protein
VVMVIVYVICAYVVMFIVYVICAYVVLVNEKV